jgi:hypothetical protein
MGPRPPAVGAAADDNRAESCRLNLERLHRPWRPKSDHFGLEEDGRIDSIPAALAAATSRRS